MASTSQGSFTLAIPKLNDEDLNALLGTINLGLLRGGWIKNYSTSNYHLSYEYELRPRLFDAIFWFILGIIPGILYLVFSRRKLTTIIQISQTPYNYIVDAIAPIQTLSIIERMVTPYIYFYNFFTREYCLHYLSYGIYVNRTTLEVFNKRFEELNDYEKFYYLYYILPRKREIIDVLKSRLRQSGAEKTTWKEHLPYYNQSIIGKFVVEMLEE